MTIPYIPLKDGVRYIEHTADLWIEASGDDINSVMKRLVEGMYGVMADRFEIGDSDEKIDLSFPAVDMETSMVDSLSELLFLFDSESKIIREPVFLPLQNEDGVGFRMKGMLHSAVVSEGKAGMEVKAVTYHGAALRIKGKDEYLGRILLDL